jgi:hypothetical protein
MGLLTLTIVPSGFLTLMILYLIGAAAAAGVASFRTALGNFSFAGGGDSATFAGSGPAGTASV